ncbi:MAG: radical SAM protein [Candidatus Cyclonatronum sp.]|uniref:radical SAM protein n=1 Tax=Cyclonatronum sp. TaxID=3024185 RepID=UPI0025BBCDA2|nr:radical SAM protein [Cyclonatronum sp.]MCH8486169.1 radical SAM protein [Cyclonatronum sp.]
MPNNREIVAARPEKVNGLDPFRPYHFLHEQEPGPDGRLRRVNTVFLTNRECPFKCVFCDLWKHTLDEPTPEGAIPAQIRYALDRLPEAEVLKLYNNGNFFDLKAIPRSDYPEIAALCTGYERVIAENHPKITGPQIAQFQELLDAELEIAIGIESIHPEVLPRLNKQISGDDIEHAARKLRETGISLRGFILLNPPWLTDPAETRQSCLDTIRFAFDAGFETVSIIPVRTGNGYMEKLEADGAYIPPDLHMLESVVREALSWQRGRVFADLWDVRPFWPGSSESYEKWESAMNKLNLHQLNQD